MESQRTRYAGPSSVAHRWTVGPPPSGLTGPEEAVLMEVLRAARIVPPRSTTLIGAAIALDRSVRTVRRHFAALYRSGWIVTGPLGPVPTRKTNLRYPRKGTSADGQ